MMADLEMVSELEDIHFKSERLESLLTCIHKSVSEVSEDIPCFSKNTFDYALYEIENELHKNNEKFGEIISKSELIRRCE